MRYFSVILFIIIFLAESLVFAQTEEELDSLMFSQNTEVKTTAVPATFKKTPVEIYGFIRNENRVSVVASDSYDQAEVVKFQSRVRLNADKKSGAFRMKISIDCSFDPEVYDSEGIVKKGQVEAQEIFLETGNALRFRMGKQLFLWGTADAFNVTNYPDQQDMREFITIDKDDKYRGVYTFSLKYIIRDYSVEACFMPFSETTLQGEGFWAMQKDDIAGMNVVFDNAYRKDKNLKDLSFALRAGGTVEDFDFHFSYFNGLNRSTVMKPELKGSVSGSFPDYDLSNACINIEPYRKRINSFGFDMAFTLDKLSVRAESAYSFDMCAVSDTDYKTLLKGVQVKAAGGKADLVKTGREHFVAYTVGADYNLWGDNGTVLLEWTQSEYITGRSTYSQPLMSKLLLMRIEDKFLNESLCAKIDTVIHTVSENQGGYTKCMLEWDFKNGLTMEGGCFLFYGEDELFEPYDDRDLLYLRAGWEF